MATEASVSLLEELANDQDPRTGGPCKWQAAIASLPEQERAQFDAVIRDRAFTVSSIFRALERREIEIARNTLERHRNGRCLRCR